MDGGQVDARDRRIASFERAELEEHATWLGKFGARRRVPFDRRWKEDSEACLVEARTRVLLETQVDVRPFEDPDRGGPDFICRPFGAGAEYFVECTVIRSKTATEHSRLSDEHELPFQEYLPLVHLLKEKLSTKAKQLAVAEKPLVLLCATLHFEAGRLAFDPIFLEGLLNGLESSRVLLAREHERDPWRTLFPSLSAVAMFGLGGAPPQPYGVLVPGASRPFDPALLPHWPFCRAAEWPSTSESVPVEWVMGSPSARVLRDGVYRG